jgi:hypothetical protein
MRTWNEFQSIKIKIFRKRGFAIRRVSLVSDPTRPAQPDSKKTLHAILDNLVQSAVARTTHRLSDTPLCQVNRVSRNFTPIVRHSFAFVLPFCLSFMSGLLNPAILPCQYISSWMTVGIITLALSAGVASSNSGLRIYPVGYPRGSTDIRAMDLYCYENYFPDVSDGLDKYDVSWENGPPPGNVPVDMRAYTLLEGKELYREGRPVNSVLPYTVYIRVENDDGSTNIPPMEFDEVLNFRLISNGMPQEFNWKNVIGERYGLDDTSDPNNIKAKVDIMTNSGKEIYVQHLNLSEGGLVDVWKLKPYNYADLDRDHKVGLNDFAIFARNYGRSDTLPREVDEVDKYADLNRDGLVTFDDLSLFCNEWLWDKDVPESWRSRL